MERGGLVREDMHIHLERGAYTLEWVQTFVEQALGADIKRIGLLEHAYLFREFLPVYTRYEKTTKPLSAIGFSVSPRPKALLIF